MIKLLTDTDLSFSPRRETSVAIRVIRPLLILFMMLAHVYALDSAGFLAAAQPLGFESWFTVYLKSVLAKTGVPLLSLISGYLAVYSLRKYGFSRLLARKAQRLLWPMIWANLLYIFLIAYPEQQANPAYRSDLSIYPFDLFGWFQATFAFYRLPANQPLFFLKDLFTCFLLLPLLIGLARIRFLNVLVIPWMAWKCIYLESAFLFHVYPVWFMRFDIVFAFYLGILLFLHSRELRLEKRSLRLASLALFPLAGSVAAVFYVKLSQAEHQVLFLWLDFVVKVISVLGCVSIMGWLVSHRGVISRFLAWLSPYSYSMFLLHAIVFHFYHRLFLGWFGQPEFFGISGVAYLLALFASTVIITVILRKLWRAASNRLRVPAS